MNEKKTQNKHFRKRNFVLMRKSIFQKKLSFNLLIGTKREYRKKRKKKKKVYTRKEPADN
jgi:hypothetical protein